jgi:hypothetical protein
MLLPWPSRQQRLDAINAARVEKEQAQARLARAIVIEHDIDRIRQQNHFAAAIADHLIRGHGNGTAR